MKLYHILGRINSMTITLHCHGPINTHSIMTTTHSITTATATATPTASGVSVYLYSHCLFICVTQYE